MDGIRTQADKIKNWGALAYFFWLCWWAISFFSWFWKRYAAHELLFVFDKQENRLLFLDFTNHYMGGKLAVSPLRHSIYDPTVQLNFYRQLLAPQHVDVSQYCQVTPWFFLYMVPFGLFPIEISYLIWNVLWCTFGLICLDQLVRYLGMKDVKERIFLCAWLFGFYPAQDTIIGGQNSWMLLGLLALYCRFWFESRDIACGVSLGLSLIRPQYFLFLLIPAIAQRRWRIVAASFSTCFILLFMSGLVFGFDTVINYPKLVAAVDSADWAVIPWRMVSIRGPLTILLEQKLAFQISSAIALLALVAFFFMWTKTKTSKAALLPAFAATIVGMLVFSPHTHVHDLICLQFRLF